MQSLQTSWDAYQNSIYSFEDINKTQVESFINRVNENGRFKLETDWILALNKLKFIRSGKLTNAASLLFANEDPGYNVHVGRLKTPSFIVDEKVIKGSLFDQVEQTMRYIIGQIKVAIEVPGGKTSRNEIFEYPLPALRELVLNAIVHRDYTSPTDIQIKIFDNSITIFNPGKLFGDITINDLKTDHYQASTRNKLIAEAFYLTKDIEKYGSGFIRVRKEIESYPTMKFEYKEMENGFFVELSYIEQKTNTRVGEKVGEKVGERLTKNQEKIIEII